jgi:hypothetical protein
MANVVISKGNRKRVDASTLAEVVAAEGGAIATQATLAAVLAKLSADPATQTTLAALLTAMGGGVTAAAPNAVTVGNTSTLILAADATRQMASITNVSSELVYVSVGAAAVSGKGVPLSALSGQTAGGTLELSGPMAGLAVYGICASGGKSVATQVGTLS